MLRKSSPLVCIALFSSLTASASEPAPPKNLVFEKHVRPILKAQCFQCHGEGEKLKGGVDLRLVRLMKTQTESGMVLVPGKPEKSLLFQQIQENEMPKGEKKLTAQQKEIIQRWIAGGAKTAREEPKTIPPGTFYTEEDRSFWFFQPVKRVAQPKVKQKSLVRTPIDAFILSRLEKQNLTFAPEADRATLIRRAYFDLLGLPPKPEEVDAFFGDPDPNAYEKLIDKLLESPHYGERWARHWMDVAGYADSNGSSGKDSERPYSWKYRDYAIRSLNAGKPLDQFITEQLAGDEMVKPPYEELKGEDLDKLIATGFLRMAPDSTGDEAPDLKLAQNEVIADTLRIVSSSLLGLTVGCAQCHDHRYDPILQSDYYRLRAVFEPAFDWKHWKIPAARAISMQSKADRDKAEAIEAEAKKMDEDRKKKYQEALDKVFEKEIVKVPEDIREQVRVARNTPLEKLSAEQKKLLRERPSANVRGSLDLYDKAADNALKEEAKKAEALRATKPQADFVHALVEAPNVAAPTFLFNRGDHDQPKQEIKPAGLSILEGVWPQSIPEKDAALPSSGRRKAFAAMLTSAQNPLTPRVLVNRVWMHHFGRGIVGTPGDFGMLGERPSHPELLDWLASEFVTGGWKLKPLHRMLMLSSVYRQSSQNETAQSADPDNKLLARMSLKRMDAEALRDAILACSGKINLELFGAPLPVARTKEGMVVLGKGVLDANGDPVSVTPLGDQEFRRSLYAQVRRSLPLNMLDTFDAPPMKPNCDARAISTVAPQSLLLMNDPFMLGQAKEMAARVQREAAGDLKAQIIRAWKLAYGKTPADADVQRSVAYVNDQTEQMKARAPKPVPPDPKKKDAKPSEPYDPAQLALASFCQALMCSNRFLYIE
jgi:hypothetical protein